MTGKDDAVRIVRTSEQAIKVIHKGEDRIVVRSPGRTTQVKIAHSGIQGPPGLRYIPTGGDVGQVLAKASASDFAMAWVDPDADSAALAEMQDRLDQQAIRNAINLIRLQGTVVRLM